MSTTFNVLDLIFFAFTAIFVLVAFFRGFVKEVFSLVIWILSFAISYFLSPIVANLLSSYFKNPIILDAVARMLIFVALFISLTLSTDDLCKAVKSRFSSAVDRSLGVFLGLLKTLLVFGFIYSLMFTVYAMVLGKGLDSKEKMEEKSPVWLKEAKCYKLIKISGDALDPMVKRFLEVFAKSFNVHEIKSMMPNSDLDKLVDEVNAVEEKVKPSDESVLDQSKSLENNPTAAALAKPVDSVNDGYNKKDVEKMNRLIEIIDDKK